MRNENYIEGVRSRASMGKTAFVALAITASMMMSVIAEAQGKRHYKGQVRECLKTNLTHFDGTIVDAAIATPALSTLVDAVVTAGLADALSADGRLTVFAPTNDAFAAIPGELLTDIVSDPAVLTEVLTYHVLPRAIDARRAVGRYYGLKTLQGQKVFVKSSRRHGPMVNQSSFNCNGIVTSNGVVWVIDSVLLPQFKQAN